MVHLGPRRFCCSPANHMSSTLLITSILYIYTGIYILVAYIDTSINLVNLEEILFLFLSLSFGFLSFGFIFRSDGCRRSRPCGAPIRNNCDAVHVMGPRASSLFNKRNIYEKKITFRSLSFSEFLFFFFFIASFIIIKKK